MVEEEEDAKGTQQRQRDIRFDYETKTDTSSWQSRRHAIYTMCFELPMNRARTSHRGAKGQMELP